MYVCVCDNAMMPQDKHTHKQRQAQFVLLDHHSCFLLVIFPFLDHTHTHTHQPAKYLHFEVHASIIITYTHTHSHTQRKADMSNGAMNAALKGMKLLESRIPHKKKTVEMLKR